MGGKFVSPFPKRTAFEFYLSPSFVFLLYLVLLWLIDRNRKEMLKVWGCFLGFLLLFLFLVSCFICSALFLPWFPGASTVRILEYNIVRVDLHGIGK